VRDDELTRLVALSPGDGRAAALIRRVCAETLALPPLPAEVAVTGPGSDAEAVVADFAEQFSVDVSMIGDEQRSRLWSALGNSTFGVVVQIYIADFVPRVRAGLEMLGVGERYLGWADGSVTWDHTTDPADAVFNGFLPAVARQTALDPVTAEIVRLRGAGLHQCRLCNSLREAAALEAGGSEDVYGDISAYETSSRLSESHKAALRYVDALICSPADIAPETSAKMRARFSVDEAVEVTFDVMRNASNKIAVAMGADAPRVGHGIERYRILSDGQTRYE